MVIVVIQTVAQGNAIGLVGQAHLVDARKQRHAKAVVRGGLGVVGAICKVVEVDGQHQLFQGLEVADLNAAGILHPHLELGVFGIAQQLGIGGFVVGAQAKQLLPHILGMWQQNGLCLPGVGIGNGKVEGDFFAFVIAFFVGAQRKPDGMVF